MYKVDPVKKERTVVGEIQYEEANFELCEIPGQRYPDPAARPRQLHSLQTTENYVIIAENSYLHDPCEFIHGDDSIAHYPRAYSYEADVDGRLVVMHKTGNETQIMNVPPMFITHVLGSYEQDDKIIFDVLQYKDASPYDYWSFTDVMANGSLHHPENFTQVVRYTVDTKTWTVETSDLVTPGQSNMDFEFSNINPAYYTRPYKYAYMTKNVFSLHGGVVKLNVEDGSLITKELPDVWFPTEPIFVASPGATEEDDGVVMMSGVDGDQEKGFIIIFNATNMDVIYQGRAPKKTLIGLHSKFFPFSVGCSEEDCSLPSSTEEPGSSSAQLYLNFFILAASLLKLFIGGARV